MSRPEGGSVEELRRQAASCRKVASASDRAGAAQALIEIAVEYELRADEIEARAETSVV
jgi:hypothetical protein